MALYAFDGTWNRNHPGTERDTNVTWLAGAYERAGGRVFYQRGVGTRFGPIGHLIGGNRNPGLSSIALSWMFAQAVRHGLPVDREVVRQNAARRDPTAPISTHRFDLIRDPFRPVAWTDRVHQSVRFRPDTRARHHNNPPRNLAVVDDAGRIVRRFTRPAGA